MKINKHQFVVIRTRKPPEIESFAGIDRDSFALALKNDALKSVHHVKLEKDFGLTTFETKLDLLTVGVPAKIPCALALEVFGFGVCL